MTRLVPNLVVWWPVQRAATSPDCLLPTERRSRPCRCRRPETEVAANRCARARCRRRWLTRRTAVTRVCVVSASSLRTSTASSACLTYVMTANRHTKPRLSSHHTPSSTSQTRYVTYYHLFTGNNNLRWDNAFSHNLGVGGLAFPCLVIVIR